MMLVLAAPLGLACALPAAAQADAAQKIRFSRKFGEDIANSIRTLGLQCPELRDLHLVGEGQHGRIMRAVCGPRAGTAGEESTVRVTVTDGGYIRAAPWTGK